MELVPLGTWPEPGGPSVNIRAIEVSDGYAYLADQSWGLRIVDLTDPSRPSPKALFSSIGARDVFAVERQVYLAGTDDVKVINVSDPADPKQIGRFTMSGGSTRVFGGNGWAYAAGGSIVYAVYGTELKPVFISSRQVRDAFVLGGLAYLLTSDGQGHLTVVDVSDPLSWRTTGRSVSFSPEGYGVFVRNGLVFIADFSNGLRIRVAGDLSYKGGIDTPGLAFHVWADDRYAYVADGDKGVAVFDVTNPATPVEVARYDTLNAQGLFVDDRYIYVADGAGGLQVLLLNHRPDPPEAVQPRDGKTVDSLTPVLWAAFNDPDGDEPVSVTWQVYGEGLAAEFEGFAREGGTIKAQVPGDVRLERGKTYAWRVGCAVPYEQEVLWSEWASFVTPEAPSPPPAEDPPHEDDPAQGPDPPAQDDPPSGDDPGGERSPGVEPEDPNHDPEPSPRSSRRYRPEPRKFTPPPLLKLWEHAGITVFLDPYRLPSPYLVRPPLPVLTSKPGSGILELQVPGCLAVGFGAPASPNMVVRR